MDGNQYSRISKLLLDRGHANAAAVLTARQSHTVAIQCGADVGASAILQLALITCANLTSRCFPGCVFVSAPNSVLSAPLLTAVGTGQTLGEALEFEVGASVFAPLSRSVTPSSTIVLGDVPESMEGIRATFDGWIAAVGPAGDMRRLDERPYCPIVGILAGALAVSEVFMAFAQMTPVATRRKISLSLWDLSKSGDHASAVGVPVEFLPSEFWVLGLGHLGNAILWTLAALPFLAGGKVLSYLNDYDFIERENFETSMLFGANDKGLKTRTAANWLQARGFDTRLMERRFGPDFRLDNSEPTLAFCGFDSNPARRALATADFSHVVEIGLGGTARNFDTISLHHWPNSRPAEELWPDPYSGKSSDEISAEIAERDRLAESDGYKSIGADKCGRVTYAGKAIAVPFVGAVAACLAVAEALRILHRGPAFDQLKLKLGAQTISLSQNDCYSASDSASLKAVDAKLDQE